MTSFYKSTGAAKEQIAVIFLQRAQKQLVGDGGSYHGKVGFKDLRKKRTKYPLSSHAKWPFVVDQARRLKNNSPATRCLGYFSEVQKDQVSLSHEIQGRVFHSIRETVLGCSPVSDKRSNFREVKSPARKPKGE